MLGGTAIGDVEELSATGGGAGGKELEEGRNRNIATIDTPVEQAVIERSIGERGVIRGSKVFQHFIYLCEIDRVFAVTNYLVIIKKNKEIDKFIFKNEESMRAAINVMKKNYREHFKAQLFYFNF